MGCEIQPVCGSSCLSSVTLLLLGVRLSKSAGCADLCLSSPAEISVNSPSHLATGVAQVTDHNWSIWSLQYCSAVSAASLHLWISMSLWASACSLLFPGIALSLPMIFCLFKLVLTLFHHLCFPHIFLWMNCIMETCIWEVKICINLHFYFQIKKGLPI